MILVARAAPAERSTLIWQPHQSSTDSLGTGFKRTAGEALIRCGARRDRLIVTTGPAKTLVVWHDVRVTPAVCRLKERLEREAARRVRLGAVERALAQDVCGVGEVRENQPQDANETGGIGRAERALRRRIRGLAVGRQATPSKPRLTRRCRRTGGSTSSTSYSAAESVLPAG